MPRRWNGSGRRCALYVHEIYCCWIIESCPGCQLWAKSGRKLIFRWFQPRNFKSTKFLSQRWCVRHIQLQLMRGWRYFVSSSSNWLLQLQKLSSIPKLSGDQLVVCNWHLYMQEFPCFYRRTWASSFMWCINRKLGVLMPLREQGLWNEGAWREADRRRELRTNINIPQSEYVKTIIIMYLRTNINIL